MRLLHNNTSSCWKRSRPHSPSCARLPPNPWRSEWRHPRRHRGEAGPHLDIKCWARQVLHGGAKELNIASKLLSCLCRHGRATLHQDVARCRANRTLSLQTNASKSVGNLCSGWSPSAPNLSNNGCKPNRRARPGEGHIKTSTSVATGSSRDPAVSAGINKTVLTVPVLKPSLLHEAEALHRFMVSAAETAPERIGYELIVKPVIMICRRQPKPPH